MLLPSLLPCDGANRPIGPARSSFLIAREAASPKSTAQSLHVSSCRALQAILGASTQPTLSHTMRPQRPTLHRSPAQSVLNRDASADPPRPPIKDRTLPFQSGRKHRLDESSPDLPLQHERSFSNASTLASTSPTMKGTPFQPSIPSPLLDQENCLELATEKAAPNSQEMEPVYSTPKRRRLAPLEMPLGLSASDFESLNMPPGYGPEPQTQGRPQPPSECNDEDGDAYWTSSDDLALVSILLNKFRLSKRDWNECARILGKDKDTLGRRWRYLVDKGNVGLRRSNERRVRGRLASLHREAGLKMQ